MALLALVFSSLGLMTATYLTYLSAFPQVSSPLCAAGAGCSQVLASQYAHFIGIPLAWIGIVGYIGFLGLFFLAFSLWEEDRRRLVLLITLGYSGLALAASAVLVWLQTFVIGAFCPLCLASATFTLALFFLSLGLWRGHGIGRLPLGGHTLAGYGLIIALFYLGLVVVIYDTHRLNRLAVVEGRLVTQEQMRHDLKLRLFHQEKAAYQIKREWLDRRIAEALIEQEAARLGKTKAALLEANVENRIKVTDEELGPMVSQLRTYTKLTGQELIDTARAWTREQKYKEAYDAYAAALEKKYRVKRYLKPPSAPQVALKDNLARWLGPEDAPISLTVFSDFSCSHCAELDQALVLLHERYPKLVRIGFRHFPIVEPGNPVFHLASECAAEQSAFWPYHDKVYEYRRANRVPDTLVLAGELGLDKSAFFKCMQSGRATAFIEASYQDGVALGLGASVPVVFINGREAGGSLTLEELTAMVEQEREALGR